MTDVYENRVRFEETDMQGVVFYANYVTYQDETMSEYLRRIGYPYSEFEQAGWDIRVVHVELDYRGSATFDDELRNSIRVNSIGDSSIDWSYQARKKQDDSLVVEGGVTHVAVDTDSGEPTRVPDGFREAVVEFQDDPPTDY